MALLAFVCAVMDMVRTQNRLLVGERFDPDLGCFSVPVADVCMIAINDNSPASPGCCRFYRQDGCRPDCLFLGSSVCSSGGLCLDL